MAHSYYRSGKWDEALTWYEKLSADYKNTKVYADRKSEVLKRIADCIAKKTQAPPKEK
jgi:hypothetical protein